MLSFRGARSALPITASLPRHEHAVSPTGAAFAPLGVQARSNPLFHFSPLDEGGKAGDALADDETMNVVRALVGGNGFKVVHVAHDAVTVSYTHLTLPTICSV